MTAVGASIGAVSATVLFMAVASLVPLAAGAQLKAIDIPDRIACASCSVELVKVVQVGGSTEKEGLMVLGPMVARDSRGRYFVAPTGNMGEVLAFDASGRLLRTIGRKGRGPGEFEQIRRIWVGPGDSLHVFDFSRYTVLTPEFAVARTAPVGMLPWDAIFLSNGESLQQVEVSEKGRLGFPLHLVAPGGAIRRSFGAEKPVHEPRNYYAEMRALSPSRMGGYWSALQTEYRIERWDTLGTLLQSVRREVPWFKTWKGRNVIGPRILSINEDAEGRLWILIHPRPSRTIVEVLDLRTGALLVHEEIPYFFQRLVGDLIWRETENAAGDPTVDIFKLVLKTRR